MKNLKSKVTVMMITLMMCLMTNVVFGQEKYATYDNLSKSDGIMLSGKEYDLSLSTTNKANVKYTEWMTTTKEKNATDLSRSLKPKINFWIHCDKTFSQFNFNLIFNI